MKLTTYDPGKKRIVLCGEIIGNTLYRNVSDKHFMRVVNGYGIQEISLEKAIAMGVKKIVLNVINTQMSWEASVDDWLKHGKVKDYGNGKQRFLSMKYLNAHKKPKPMADILKEREDIEVQNRLF